MSSDLSHIDPLLSDRFEKPKTKRKRPKFIRKVICRVCRDVANDHLHYGATTCYSCRAFFRRAVVSNASYFCFQDQSCEINKHNRKNCQFCRFKKCLLIGMQKDLVMKDENIIKKKGKTIVLEAKENLVTDILCESVSGEENLERKIPNSSESSTNWFSLLPIFSRSNHSCFQNRLSTCISSFASTTPRKLLVSATEFDHKQYKAPKLERLLFSDSDKDLVKNPIVSKSIGKLMVASNYINAPVMPFTKEELALVTNVISIEKETTKSMPLPNDTLQAILHAVQKGTSLSHEAAVEGYTLCTKRIIKFSTKIDLFQEFNLQDRKNLLLFNTEMLVNIRSARILRPEYNLIEQLSIVFGKNPVVVDSSKSSALPIKKRLEYRQLYSSPWASEQKEEERFFFLMNNIFELQMDQITTAIVSLMALFSQVDFQI